MGVAKEKFGVTKDGREVYAFTLSNSNGVRARVINYGAILVNLFVPDKDGNVEDVVLGFDSLEGYFDNGSFLGATIGPNANRIGGASRLAGRPTILTTTTVAIICTAIKRKDIINVCGMRMRGRTASRSLSKAGMVRWDFRATRRL